MSLKTFKPYTKSTRGTVLVDRKNLWKGKPLKSLSFGKTSTGGRNNLGRITSRRRGGGHRRRYRIIDFKRNKYDIKGKIITIEYDPNRSARIALVEYEDGERRYILSPDGLKVGNYIVSSRDNKIPFKTGNNTCLRSIPEGLLIHNIELKPLKGAQLARSAGTYAKIMAKENNMVTVKLPSGEMRMVHENCQATIGVVGNKNHENIKIGKAGRSRWLGKRPKVRGVVMNPVDHPHGGGEGRTSGGRHPVSPWGTPAKGYKTRKKNKQSNKFIVKRRK